MTASRDVAAIYYTINEKVCNYTRVRTKKKPGKNIWNFVFAIVFVSFGITRNNSSQTRNYTLSTPISIFIELSKAKKRYINVDEKEYQRSKNKAYLGLGGRLIAKEAKILLSTCNFGLKII